MSQGLGALGAVLLFTIAGFTGPGMAMSTQAVGTTSPTSPAQGQPASVCLGASGPPPYPPGTSDTGITNATALLDAHQTQLANTAYAEQLEMADVREVRGENGTFQGFEVRTLTKTATNSSNASLVTYTRANESEVTSQWLTDTEVAVKLAEQTTDGTSILYMYGRTDDPAVDPMFAESMDNPARPVLRPYLEGVEYAYDGTVTRDNQTLHEFSSTGLNESAQTDRSSQPFPDTLSRINVTVLVDSQGVIRALDATKTHTRENETVTAETNYSVQTTGDVAPTKPDWACTELPEITPSLVGNGTVIALEHTGGVGLSEAGLLLNTPRVNTEGEVTEPFEPGETIYLYVLADDPNQIRVSRGEPPAVNDSFVAFGGDTLSLTVHRTVVNSSGQRPVIELAVRPNATDSTPNQSRARSHVGGIFRSPSR